MENGTSVSGFSSGGFMAVQLHVALSSTFRAGVGVIAGGPFYCNKGQLATSLVNCAVGIPAPDTAGLVTTTKSWATAGAIDDVANIGSSKVYIFHGSMDTTIQGAVVDATKQYYSSFATAANIKYRTDIAANHAFVTENFGNACGAHASPYVNDCGFDLAGDLLAWIYGSLQAKNTGAPAGQLVSFDQSEFVAGGAGHGLAEKGWAYVPPSCASGTACRLHVVLHGCQQNETTAGIGGAVYESAGYNRWADTNDIIVLYPQTGPSSSNGCWDYWGYDSPDFAKKAGPQIEAIAKMVARVQGK